MISPKERGHSCPYFPFHAAKLPIHHEADKSVRAPFSSTAHHHRFAMKPSSSLHDSITPPLRAWLLAALLLSSFILHPSSFAAESPLYIPFQGQVTNQTGTIVADGQYSVIFNLYDQAVGGQPVWSERHVKIGVTRGMINVFLGSISPLTSVDFSQTKYLGITVDTDNLATTADPEMVPRSLIMPAFHAKKAENSTKLAGNDWSAFFVNGSNDATNNPATGFVSGAKVATGSIAATQLAADAVTTAKVLDGAITSGKIADGTITSSDFSTALQADSVMPAGMVSAFAGTAAPAGWLMCDGSAVSRATYSRLFASIGVAHGSGDGTTTFNLPDYRGRFLRGVDGAAGNDPDKSTRPAMAGGGNTGNSVGSIQTDAFASHTHDQKIQINAGGGQYGYGTSGATPNSFQTLTQTGAAGATNETRPKNAYVNYIIKL